MASFLENFRNIMSKKPGGDNDQESMVVPKAPSFKYKNPVVDNNIEYWRAFADKGTMNHYDDFLHILDEASTLDTAEDIKNYVNTLKDTTSYKVNQGVRTWVNDLESLYSMPEYKKYDRFLPLSIMRRQTEIAKQAVEGGYKKRPQYMERVPSPSELLPKTSTTFK